MLGGNSFLPKIVLPYIPYKPMPTKSYANGYYPNVQEPDPYASMGNVPENNPYATIDHYKQTLGSVGQEPIERKGMGLSNVLMTVLDVMQRPQSMVTNILSNFTDSDPNNNDLGSTLQAGWQGLTGERKSSTTDVFNNMGWKNDYNQKWYQGGNLLRNVTGFAGDVLLDPTTYLTGGTLKLALGALKGSTRTAVTKILTEAGEKYMKASVTDVIQGLVEITGKNADDITKQIAVHGAQGDMVSRIAYATGDMAKDGGKSMDTANYFLEKGLDGLNRDKIKELSDPLQQSLRDIMGNVLPNAETSINKSIGGTVGQTLKKALGLDLNAITEQGTKHDVVSKIIDSFRVKNTIGAVEDADKLNLVRSVYAKSGADLTDEAANKVVSTMYDQEYDTLDTLFNAFDTTTMNPSELTSKLHTAMGVEIVSKGRLKTLDSLKAAIGEYGTTASKVKKIEGGIEFTNGLQRVLDAVDNRFYIKYHNPFTNNIVPLIDVSKYAKSKTAQAAWDMMVQLNPLAPIMGKVANKASDIVGGLFATEHISKDIVNKTETITTKNVLDAPKYTLSKGDIRTPYTPKTVAETIPTPTADIPTTKTKTYTGVYKDKATGNIQHITREARTKTEFIQELRANGIPPKDVLDEKDVEKLLTRHSGDMLLGKKRYVNDIDTLTQIAELVRDEKLAKEVKLTPEVITTPTAKIPIVPKKVVAEPIVEPVKVADVPQEPIAPAVVESPKAERKAVDVNTANGITKVSDATRSKHPKFTAEVRGDDTYIYPTGSIQNPLWDNVYSEYFDIPKEGISNIDDMAPAILHNNVHSGKIEITKGSIGGKTAPILEPKVTPEVKTPVVKRTKKTLAPVAETISTPTTELTNAGEIPTPTSSRIPKYTPEGDLKTPTKLKEYVPTKRVETTTTSQIVQDSTRFTAGKSVAEFSTDSIHAETGMAKRSLEGAVGVFKSFTKFRSNKKLKEAMSIYLERNKSSAARAQWGYITGTTDTLDAKAKQALATFERNGTFKELDPYKLDEKEIAIIQEASGQNTVFNHAVLQHDDTLGVDWSSHRGVENFITSLLDPTGKQSISAADKKILWEKWGEGLDPKLDVPVKGVGLNDIEKTMLQRQADADMDSYVFHHGTSALSEAPTARGGKVVTTEIQDIGSSAKLTTNAPIGKMSSEAATSFHKREYVSIADHMLHDPTYRPTRDIIELMAMRDLQSQAVGLNKSIVKGVYDMIDNVPGMRSLMSRTNDFPGAERVDLMDNEFVFAHPEIATQLKRITNIYNDSSRAERELSQVWINMSNNIKMLQTTYNLPFHIKNDVGEPFMNWLARGFMPKANKEGLEILKAIKEEDLVTIGDTVFKIDKNGTTPLYREYTADIGNGRKESIIETLYHNPNSADYIPVDPKDTVAVEAAKKSSTYRTTSLSDVQAHKNQIVRSSGSNATFFTLGDKEYTAKDAMRLFADEGLGWSGVSKGNIAKNMEDMIKSETGTTGVVGKVTHGLQNMGDLVETHSRLALFIESLNEGMDIKSAAAEVRKYHVDYRDLTKFERNYARNLMPFYTYMRKNLPIQIRTVMERQNRVNMIGQLVDSAYEAVQRDNNDQPLIVPDYLKEGMAIPIDVDGQGNVKYFNWGLPIADLARLKYNMADLAKENFFSMLSPLVKMPIENTTNTDLMFESTIDKFPGEKKALLPNWDNSPKVLPSVVDRIIKSLGVVNTARGALGTAAQMADGGQGANPMALMGLGGVVPVKNQSDVRNQQAYDYRDQLYAQIQRLRQKGINVPQYTPQFAKSLVPTISFK